MQEKGTSGVTSRCCQIASLSSPIPLAGELQLPSDHLNNISTSSAPNRDSGIFEDYPPSSPLSPQQQQKPPLREKNPLLEGAFADIACCSDRDPLDEEELSGASSSCDSDRVLHASLPSLDSEVELSAAPSSLVSDEEEEEEEFSFSSDTDVSSDASLGQGNSSSSFGYHSLLNDATPDAVDHSDNQNFTDSQLSFRDESEKEEHFPNHLHHRPPESSSRLLSCLNPEVDQASLGSDDILTRSASSSISNISFTEEEEDEDKGEDDEEEEDSPLPSLSLSFSSSTSLSADSSLSSEDENPSDIESKMAETEVKMHDALLSNGREELAHRTRRMRSHAHPKTKDLLNALGETPLKFPLKAPLKEKPFRENNNLRHRNNHINNNYKYFLTCDRPKPHTQERPHSRPPAPSSLPLPLADSVPDEEEDSRLPSSGESPIVDAYEKECRDAPEKEAPKGAQDKEKDKAFSKETKEAAHSEQEEDMRAFEVAMKEAIRKKEEETHSNGGGRLSFDLDFEGELRPRPSPQQRRRERNALRRLQSSSSGREKDKQISPDAGEFDVYTMETALPKIDWEAIEAHFQATKEEERRRRTDREEIRRKLAMGTDEETFNNQQLKKPSLQSRLQSGKNLQICFMNETASDCESQCSDTESTQDRIDEMDGVLNSKESKLTDNNVQNMDFVTHQARLQAEARLALAQAKEMARMQMEIEKQNQKKSPITEIVKDSFNKIGFPFPAGKRRMSRQLLTDMNVAQLQVIVNDLHTQIESELFLPPLEVFMKSKKPEAYLNGFYYNLLDEGIAAALDLNEDLVRLLLNRDDLHMEQDSMLVDIEDLTKHLGAKQRVNSAAVTSNGIGHPQFPDTCKGLLRSSTKTQKLKSFVKK